MALNGEKPVPYDLSDWADGREIFFRCDASQRCIHERTKQAVNIHKS